MGAISMVAGVVVVMEKREDVVSSFEHGGSHCGWWRRVSSHREQDSSDNFHMKIGSI